MRAHGYPMNASTARRGRTHRADGLDARNRTPELAQPGIAKEKVVGRGRVM